MLALIVIGLIASFLLPSKINFVHEQKLDSSPEAVFAQINDLKNWDNWSVWNQMDPDMEKTYGDKTAGPGAWYSWKSDNKNVGSGKMTISNSVPNESVDTELDFGDQGQATANLNLTPADGGGTNVAWTFDTEIKNPIGKIMFNLMGKNMVKKNYGQGLTNMDQYIKDNPGTTSTSMVNDAGVVYDRSMVDPSKYDFKVADWAGGPALCVEKQNVKVSNIANVLGEGYGKIMAEVGKQGLEMVGMPYCMYPNFNEENMTTDMEMGVMLKSDGQPAGDVQSRTYPASRALMVDHYGDYHSTALAHWAIEDYMKANNLESSAAPREVYVTDPTTEPDPNKWLTQVIYPLK